MDLTNAGSVIGRISGGAGSTAATDAVFRKLMEESVKAGLDKSEYREEQRKFADTTSEILAKSGVKTGQDAAQVLQGFSRFMGQDTTIKGLEGAKSAYQEYQASNAETSGRGGVLNFAGMMQQGLGKIGAKAIGALMELPEEDLIETNDRVIAIAARYGMSPKELIKKTTEAKEGTQDVKVGFNKKYRDILTKAGVTGKMSYEELQKQTPEVRKAYEETRVAPSVSSPYTTAQNAEALSLRFQRGGGISAPNQVGPATSVEADLQKRTGRAGDEVIRSTGQAAQAMLENFRNFKKEITPASEALDTFTKKIILLAGVMSMTPDKDRAAVSKYVGEELGKQIKGQQNGSKPGGGR
jgi:hypothetical protein